MWASISEYLSKSAILARLLDSGYVYKIHPNETAAGLTNANLTFGFDYGDLARYQTAANPLQTAHDCMPAAGGTITVRPGSYAIPATVNFTKRTYLRCLGGFEASGVTAAVVFTKAATINGPAIYITGNACKLEHFLLVGAAGNGGDGIQVNGGRCTLQNLGVQGMGGRGIRIGSDPGGGNANGWRMDNVVCYSNNTGCYISDDDNAANFDAASPNANAGTSTNLQLISNTVDGLVVNYQGANVFMGTLAESNGSVGVRVKGGSQWDVFIGGDLNENNVSNAMIIEAPDASASGIGPGYTTLLGVDYGPGAGQGTLADSGRGTQIIGAYDFQANTLGVARFRTSSTGNPANFTDNYTFTDSGWSFQKPILLGGINGTTASLTSIQTGGGSPNGGVAGKPGSIFLRNVAAGGGLQAYINVDGTNTGWYPIGVPVTTAAAIGAAANAINTDGKFAGKLAFDNTNNRIYVASGSAANAAWYYFNNDGNVVPA
jgi:hypothetical protein